MFASESLPAVRERRLSSFAYKRILQRSINITVCLGTYTQIHQTIYMFSAECTMSHFWHSCKSCASLTGWLWVIRSDTESASIKNQQNQFWQLHTLGNQITYDAYYLHAEYIRIANSRFIWQSTDAATMALQP